MQYLHSKKKIHKDLTELGLKEGMFVNLKCSYNSIGKIEGGPMSLIEIILNIIKENGLLITDSFVDCYKINSLEFKKNIVNQKTKSYAGLIANTILDHIDCKRSFHPIQKFALIGNYANELSINHTEKHYAYDILKIISHEKNSFNLRIGPDNKVLGVGTTHVATGVLNIEKYEKNLGVLYEDKDKNKLLFKRDWIGICSNTLINLNYFYENNSNIEMKRGKVGGAKSLLTNMNQTLNEELKGGANEEELDTTVDLPDNLEIVTLNEDLQGQTDAGKARILKRYLKQQMHGGTPMAKYGIQKFAPGGEP